jgi:NCS1 family nucleobase:cation symporter-1
MWIAGILSILVALVFPMEQYENFLFFIGAMFVPLFGVILTDYFLIRSRQLNKEEIYKEGGEYWYSKGFNIAAIVSWAIGFIVYEFIAIMKYTIGGSLPSLIAAGLVYYIITQQTKKRT